MRGVLSKKSNSRKESFQRSPNGGVIPSPIAGRKTPTAVAPQGICTPRQKERYTLSTFHTL